MAEDEADRSPAPWVDAVGGRLMAAVAGGDARAFESVYDLHSASVFGLALHVLRDAQDAEEVAGDVFLSAWRNAASFDPTKGRLIGWLLTTTRRRSIDRLRTRGRVRAIADAVVEAPGASGTPDPVAEEFRRKASDGDVATVLASLPAAQNRALSLALVDGYTHAEIAMMVGVPLGTVKSRVRLGLCRLRATLADGGPQAALLGEVLALA